MVLLRWFLAGTGAFLILQGVSGTVANAVAPALIGTNRTSRHSKYRYLL